MLKTTFKKENSKQVTFRDAKQFQWETFKKGLTGFLRNCSGEYEYYAQYLIKVFNILPPKM